MIGTERTRMRILMLAVATLLSPGSTTRGQERPDRGGAGGYPPNMPEAKVEPAIR